VHPRIFETLSAAARRTATAGVDFRLTTPSAGSQTTTPVQIGISLDVGDDAFARVLRGDVQRGAGWVVCYAATPHSPVDGATGCGVRRCVDVTAAGALRIDPLDVAPAEEPYTLSVWLQPRDADGRRTCCAVATTASSVTVLPAPTPLEQ